HRAVCLNEPQSGFVVEARRSDIARDALNSRERQGRRNHSSGCEGCASGEYEASGTLTGHEHGFDTIRSVVGGQLGEAAVAESAVASSRSVPELPCCIYARIPRRESAGRRPPLFRLLVPAGSFVPGGGGGSAPELGGAAVGSRGRPIQSVLSSW